MFSEFPDLPPAQAPSEFGSVAEAEARRDGGRGRRSGTLGFNAVLAPDIDVGTADGHRRARRARVLGRPRARSPSTRTAVVRRVRGRST